MMPAAWQQALLKNRVVELLLNISLKNIA